MNHRYSPRLLIRTALILILLITFLYDTAAIPGAYSRQDSANFYQFSLPRMGTQFQISLYHTDANEAKKAALKAFDRVEELEDIFSDYREQSEVTRLCQVAVGKPWAISPELFLVLERSLRISRLSGGAFDVTVGPVVQVWRDARRRRRAPDPQDLKKAERLVGYSNILLDPDARTAMLKLANMKIDLGGIAKGYAADQSLAALKSRGISRALVAGGGDMAIGAAPPGKPGWKIAIKNPDPGTTLKTDYLILHDVGVATSGDTYQFLEIDGRRYSHIINPGTGMGLTDSASATIIAPDGITADALATAVCVMPVAEGLKMIESVPGASAAIVRRGLQGLQRFSSARFPQTANFGQRPNIMPGPP